MMIQVDARDEGDFIIHWQRIPPSPPPANDDFADALTFTDAVPFTVDIKHATVECGELPVAGFWDGPYGSVWYKWEPTLDQNVQITLDSTGIDPELDYQFVDVYRGTTLENLFNITPADDGDGNASYDDAISFEFVVEAGETYYFRFSAYADQGWDQNVVTIEAFGDNIFPPFITPTTTVFTPSLAPAGTATKAAPFIAPTTVMFPPYLSGPMDIPAPFIDSTSVVYTPYLVTADRARVSQLATEVILSPDSPARVTQVAVEYIILPTGNARVSQEPVEYIFLPDDTAAYLTQIPVEVLQRSLRESVIVIIID
jgi:hypothetical protein